MAEDQERSHKEPGFTFVTPVLCVNDLPQSLTYYRDRLGFAVAWAWAEEEAFEAPSHPTFACVCRGEVSVFLCEKGQGNPGSWLMLNLSDREQLDVVHREYQQSGAKIVQPPTDESWGMREMIVADLDGNTLRIGVGVGT